MNDILKQRLVGALILVALGVVFWPIIFVEPDEEQLAEQYLPPPEVSVADIESPQVGALGESPEREAHTDSVASALPGNAVAPGEEGSSPPPVESSATAELSDTSSSSGSVRTEAPQRPAMDAGGVPVAWTLQVATVSSGDKAENLRQQLLAMKYKVYVTTVPAGGKKLYRVCIGPQVERVELEKLQSVINAKFGVTSMVARYSP